MGDLVNVMGQFEQNHLKNLVFKKKNRKLTLNLLKKEKDIDNKYTDLFVMKCRPVNIS